MICPRGFHCFYISLFYVLISIYEVLSVTSSSVSASSFHDSTAINDIFVLVVIILHVMGQVRNVLVACDDAVSIGFITQCIFVGTRYSRWSFRVAFIK